MIEDLEHILIVPWSSFDSLLPLSPGKAQFISEIVKLAHKIQNCVYITFILSFHYFVSFWSILTYHIWSSIRGLTDLCSNFLLNCHHQYQSKGVHQAMTTPLPICFLATICNQGTTSTHNCHEVVWLLHSLNVIHHTCKYPAINTHITNVLAMDYGSASWLLLQGQEMASNVASSSMPPQKSPLFPSNDCLQNTKIRKKMIHLPVAKYLFSSHKRIPHLLTMVFKFSWIQHLRRILLFAYLQI